MAGAIHYLSVADVLALHIAVMERLGYQPEPLRDLGLLESALRRADMAAHYEQADLVRQAILLAAGIAQNQPFVDGNKRTAYIVCVRFLESNGFRLTADPVALADQLVRLAERQDRLDDATDRFEGWLRANTAIASAGE
jgi:death-on-curing protein